MSDGRYKPAREIVAGDVLLSQDGAPLLVKNVTATGEGGEQVRIEHDGAPSWSIVDRDAELKLAE